MSLSVDGQKCPVCNGYLFDEDDVVFCPVCGAPHHRDCYAAKGNCALAELHGTENEYKRPQKEDTVKEDEQTESESKFSDTEGLHFGAIPGEDIQLKTVCPNCKAEVPNTFDTCPNCKSPLPVSFPSLDGRTVDPLGGVPNNVRLHNHISPLDVALYTAVNTPRYVKKFFTMRKRNPVSWNWASFLFPNAWFFYRKIYFPGIMFFILMVISGVMTMAINLVFSGMTFESTNQMATYIVQNIDTINKTPLIVAFVGSFLDLIIRIFAGAYGDSFYRRSAIERITDAKGDTESELNEKQRINKKGGLNPLLGLLGIMGLRWVPYLIFGLL